ncbi:CmpA/NrtA family ABC transporter substrate-binding protein [Cupriavidus basilensis]
MNLNHNGQAITLSTQAGGKRRQGRRQPASADGQGKALNTPSRRPSRPAPHAMWLYYWLAANGINPMKDAKAITVPPPQMVANMRVGNMDGFCVGEPWGARAIADKIGFTAETTQAIWKDHPEKAAGHHRRVRAEVPEYGPRHGCRRAGSDRSSSMPRPPTAARPRKRSPPSPTSTRIWTSSSDRMLGRYTQWPGARPGTIPTR